MGKLIRGAVVSLNGFIADDNDDVGSLFDWLGNGEVTWSFPGAEYKAQTTQASADFIQRHYRNLAAVMFGRRVFDMTNGWNGKLAAGEHIFVVTHQPPTNWEHTGSASFTFVDSVEKAIAKAFAGDCEVDVAAGQVVCPLLLPQTGIEPTFEGPPDTGFDLVSTKVLDGRVLLLEYRPTGAPPYSD